jgi:hypothetical protein
MTPNSYSGLSPEHRAQARRTILHGVDLLLRNPRAIHYTQGSQRWEGINKKLRAQRGQYPTHGDCSSTHTWLIWCAVTGVKPDIRDLVNGLHWKAGFTGTIIHHGKIVHNIRNAKVGDAVLYGPLPNCEHVATYIGGGLVFSHGGEAGPFKLHADYRSDRVAIRRSI